MSNDASTAAQEKLREFTYLVSHDLNAPLRSIGSFSNILFNEYRDKFAGEGLEYLTLIAGEAKRAQDMLQGLLEYSRLDTMAKTATTRIHTQLVFGDCLLVLKEDIAAAGASITAVNLPVIQADAEQFMQLLLYLFQNALTFRAPERALLIRFNIEDKGDHWHGTVTDNGIGIEEPYREKAFVIFRQLHVHGTYPGIGVGLALARKIVERHRGKIWIEGNGQEAGITVHFTLAKP